MTNFEKQNTPETTQYQTKEELNRLSDEIISDSLSNKESLKRSNTFKVSTEDLKDGPFDYNNHMVPLTFGNLLGEGQAQTILNMNNLNGKNKDNKLEKNQTLNIPLVYPELKSEIPDTWDSYVKKYGFDKYKNSKSKNKIVVTKCSNGMNALAYYKNGKLTMATYVSIGVSGHKTLTGEYPVGDKIIRKKSIKYNNSPMPYAIRIFEGFFLHQGATNGKPKSHGCVRMPGLYERRLYYEMSEETKKETSIILDKLY